MGRLDQIADGRPWPLPAAANWRPQHTYFPCCRLDHAEQHSNGRSLASPVEAQKRVDLALDDAQRQMVDGGNVAVALDQTKSFDDYGHAALKFATTS